MKTLYFKINKPIDIESVSDSLAGFATAIRIAPNSILEVDFNKSLDEPLLGRIQERIVETMESLGAEEAPELA